MESFRKECQLMDIPHQIVVQGKENLKKQPLPSLENIPGFELIEKQLRELNVKTGTALQLYAAPYILAGRNSFLIGPSSSQGGKSLSYLMPVLTKLRKDARAGNKLEGSGPLALIVCSSNKSGCKIGGTVTDLIGQDDHILNAVFLEENYLDTSQRTAKRRLDGKYDVIVATAECAAEMVENVHSYFNYDRLSFLIFDDADILLKYKQKEFQTIIQGFRTYIEKAGARSCLHQTIFCTSQWTTEIEKCLIHFVDLPVLIISPPIQILNYCKFDIRVVKASSDAAEGSFEVFKGILEKHREMNRILVVASQRDTLNSLAALCKKDGINVNVIGQGRAGIKDISSAKWNWTSSNFGRVIILTSDISVHELQISTASLLIHYDIPVGDVRTFALRFSSMWGNARDLTKENSESSRPDVISYVIIGPSIPEEATIVTKLHKLGATVSSELLDSVKQATKSLMDDRKLCHGFKCFGRCIEFDETTCRDRHYFTENDFHEPSVLPRTGQVELRIKELMRPNLFRAQVIRYGEKDPKTNRVIKITDCVSEVLERSEVLKEKIYGTFDDSTDDVERPSSFNPGTKVVIAHREKSEYRLIYTRAEIMKVVTRTQSGFPNSVLVNCIDIGETLEINVETMFAMPLEMEDVPAFGVEVILANTAPPLGELDFRRDQYSKARNVFKMAVLDADIALSIGNTIWVKRLVQRKKVDCGQIKVLEVWDALTELTNERVLVRNPSHMDTLYKLCEKANFSCDMYMTSSASINNEVVQDDAAAHDEDDLEAHTKDDENLPPNNSRTTDAQGLHNSQASVDDLRSSTDEEDDDDGDLDFNFDVSTDKLRSLLEDMHLPLKSNGIKSESFCGKAASKDLPYVSRAICNGDSNAHLNGSSLSAHSRHGHGTSTRSNVLKNSPINDAGGDIEATAVSSSSLSGKTVKTPMVTWYEKNDNLFVKVLIVDIKDYECSITPDKTRLIFKTKIPPDYGFDLKLFKKVEVNPVINVWGQYCEIKLTKRMRGVPWSALAEKKLNWVKPDFAVLYEKKDNTEEDGLVNQIKYTSVNYKELEEMEDNSDEDILDDGTNEAVNEILYS